MVSGKVEPMDESQLLTLPEPGTPRHEHLKERGAVALSSGQCALAVLAGGMATRMGGVIKALVPATGGRTFFDSGAPSGPSEPTPLVVTVPVTPSDVLRIVPPLAFGMHASVYDNALNEPALGSQLGLGNPSHPSSHPQS